MEGGREGGDSGDDDGRYDDDEMMDNRKPRLYDDLNHALVTYKLHERSIRITQNETVSSEFGYFSCYLLCA